MINGAVLSTDSIEHEDTGMSINSTLGKCFEVLEKPSRVCKHSISYFSINPKKEVKNKILRRRLLLKVLELLTSNGDSKPVVDGLDTIYSMEPVHHKLQAAPSETFFDITDQSKPTGESTSYRVRVSRQRDIKFDDVAVSMTNGKCSGGSESPTKNYVRALNALLQSILSQQKEWFCVNKNLCLSKEVMGKDVEAKPQKRRAKTSQHIQHVKLHDGMSFSIDIFERKCGFDSRSKGLPWKLSLTISPRPTLFVEACNLGTLYRDYLKAQEDNFQGDGDDRKSALYSFIKKLDVTVGYTPSFGNNEPVHIKQPQTPDDLPSDTRRRRVVSVGRIATEQKFKLEKSGMAPEDVSVSQYFKMYYHYKLRFPNLPVVNIGASANDICTNDRRTEVWVPMELLWVEEQPIFHFPPLQMKDGFEAIEREYENAVRSFEANLIDKSSKVVQVLNPTVLKELFEITFKPEAEAFKGYFAFSPSESSQKKLQIKAPEFPKSPQMTRFLTLKHGVEKHTEKEQESIQEGYERLLEAFQMEGGLSSRQQPAYDYDVFQAVLESNGNIGSFLTRFSAEGDQLLFVGLEGPREEQTDVQAKIRRWCDKNSIPTVFFDVRKFQKTMKHWERADKGTDVPGIRHATGYARALLTKSVHRYTRGIPSTQKVDPTAVEYLRSLLPKTMVVGASLVSSGIGPSDNFPSVAAVTTNLDDDFVRYQGRFRLQLPEEKIIASLSDMLKDMLFEYAQRHDNRLPESIVYFREGVSENHFDMVRSDEIRQMAMAYGTLCKEKPELAAPYLTPKITFIALSKRAKPRFFPDYGGTDKATDKNLKAGMVVDAPEFQRTGVKRREFDFHLQSHSNRCDSAKQCGFTSNTHYFVLQHENEWGLERIERITNKLCRINAVPAADSYVAPVYYSGKICQRARSYLRALAPANHASLSHEQVIREVEESDAWPESHVLGKEMFWL
ncbi:rna interference and silencing protein [Diplodia corticola]|uniref:Rna interference and silencing protein n=1 Tax=Diplodia corticola TaxID=236234 RepID=A0A1J9R9Y7_9PEZI|nr:rna interference and silencing protein [Diplodia corticola]OJD37352.1 rna interference and silencing protein [Diplodia corticola]